MRWRSDRADEAFAQPWKDLAQLLSLDMDVEEARLKSVDLTPFSARYAELGDKLTTRWSVVSLERAATLVSGGAQKALFARCVERGRELLVPNKSLGACEVHAPPAYDEVRGLFAIGGPTAMDITRLEARHMSL